jgi:hypothetical protein
VRALRTELRRRLAPVAALLLLAPLASRSEDHADVLRVVAQGRPGAYRLAVTIKSPDRDCNHYADWWEVVSEQGQLLHRRVLMHSHPDEQPFTRPDGPVALAADQTVVVRAHFHPTGYGGAALRGSVARGFAPWPEAPAGFAAGLAHSPPLPTECWR